MNKICTTIEQSKKLIELGIDVNTADMCHRYRWSNNSFMNLPCAEKARESITGDIPAWSLSALLGLIQWDYRLEKTLFDQSDLFTYSIVCDDLNYRTFEYDNEPLDAAFEMVCWLKENGNI